MLHNTKKQLSDDEVLTFPNGDTHAISNQGGRDNIRKFLKWAQEPGIDITEASQKYEP